MNKILVYGLAMLLVLSMVTAIPKYKEIQLNNGMCLYQPINQKVSQNHLVKAEDVNSLWRYNPVPCTSDVKEVNLEELGQLDWSSSQCKAGEMQTINGCATIVGGLDGFQYNLVEGYTDQHNNAFTTVAKHPIKKMVCREEWVLEKTSEE